MANHSLGVSKGGLPPSDVERGIRLMGEFPLCIGCFDEQPEEMCLAAVRADPDALQFVREPSHAVICAAIDGDFAALRHVPDPGHDACLYAIGKSPEAMRHIWNQTDEICADAIRLDDRVWERIVDPTLPMCQALVEQVGLEEALERMAASDVDDDIIVEITQEASAFDRPAMN